MGAGLSSSPSQLLRGRPPPQRGFTGSTPNPFGNCWFDQITWQETTRDFTISVCMCVVSRLCHPGAWVVNRQRTTQLSPVWPVLARPLRLQTDYTVSPSCQDVPFCRQKSVRPTCEGVCWFGQQFCVPWWISVRWLVAWGNNVVILGKNRRLCTSYRSVLSHQLNHHVCMVSRWLIWNVTFTCKCPSRISLLGFEYESTSERLHSSLKLVKLTCGPS